MRSEHDRDERAGEAADRRDVGAGDRRHVRDVLDPAAGEVIAQVADAGPDLGELHLAEMVFPTMIQRHEAFEILHEHSWPGAMTPGADVMWYPYAAMFTRETDELVVEVKFPSALTFIRGYIVSLSSGTCVLSNQQPEECQGSPNTFKWMINNVSNEEIYSLVFER